MRQVSKPKRHHSVPEFLQQRFTDADGRFFACLLSAPQRKIFPANPGGVFVQGHLYSTIAPDGTTDASQELVYAALDGAASLVVEKIIAAVHDGRTPNLTLPERETWDLFFYQQMKRVPEMIQQLEQKRSFSDRFRDAIPRLEERLGRPLTDEELADLSSPDFQRRVKKNAVVRAQADPGQVVQILLSNLSLRIGLAPSGSQFLLASRPVARLGQPSQPFTDPAIELWLPLAPDVAIGPGGGGPSEQVVGLTPDKVEAINSVLARQSDLIASADRSLLEDYVSRVATV